MTIDATNAVSTQMLTANAAANASKQPSVSDKNALTHVKFNEFVGQTFFGQLLKSMRSSVGKPAYFNGGQAEEIFQQQLDQTLAEKLTAATADSFSGPMYQLFSMQRM